MTEVEVEGSLPHRRWGKFSFLNCVLQFISFSDENEAAWPLIWSDQSRQVMAKIRLLAKNDPISLYT